MLYSLTPTWRRLTDTVRGFAHFEKGRAPEALPKANPQPLETWEDEGGRPTVRRAE